MESALSAGEMVRETLYTTEFCNASVQVALHLTPGRPSSICSCKYILWNVRGAISVPIRSFLKSQVSSYTVLALHFILILLPSIQKDTQIGQYD